jgi:hypothetical protein
MSRVRASYVLAMTVAMMLGRGTPARADATAFIGANTTPENRRVQGFAIGTGVLLFGFEFEYGSTPESKDPLGGTAPSLKTGSMNVLLQAPFVIYGFQPYVTTGAGLYRERLDTVQQTGFAPNIGGGVKISLIGPVRLRVDYRVFKLGDAARFSPAHRIYAGINLKF